MQEQVLRDKYGKRMGVIQTASDGKQIIRDAHGVKLGTYEPRLNVTRDSRGNRIGTGNLLTSLL